VLSLLEGVEPRNDSWAALCPSHDDHKPSLTLTENATGVVLMHRHAGCQTVDVLAAVGLNIRDLYAYEIPSNSPIPKKRRQCWSTADAGMAGMRARFGNATATSYDYRSADGQHIGRICRFDLDGKGTKEIRPLRLESGEWVEGGMHKPRPLYDLPGVISAERVIVVEGEKCADAISQSGLFGTTSAQGAMSATGTDWKPI